MLQNFVERYTIWFWLVGIFSFLNNHNQLSIFTLPVILFLVVARQKIFWSNYILILIILVELVGVGRARGTQPPLPGLAGGDNVPLATHPPPAGVGTVHPCTLLHCAAVCCLLHLLGGTGAKITLRATRRHYSPPGQGGHANHFGTPKNLKSIF